MHQFNTAPVYTANLRSSRRRGLSTRYLGGAHEQSAVVQSYVSKAHAERCLNHGLVRVPEPFAFDTCNMRTAVLA